jgi:hypothetical protein
MIKKAVILAGGRGTRLGAETQLRPKPMVEIGGRPILWHIMKLYAAHGIKDFVICLGYKGHMIKEFFANYVLHSADVTIDLGANSIAYHNAPHEPWRVTAHRTPCCRWRPRFQCPLQTGQPPDSYLPMQSRVKPFGITSPVGPCAPMQALASEQHWSLALAWPVRQPAQAWPGAVGTSHCWTVAVARRREPLACP